jgi:hypothetical protein
MLAMFCKCEERRHTAKSFFDIVRYRRIALPSMALRRRYELDRDPDSVCDGGRRLFRSVEVLRVILCKVVDKWKQMCEHSLQPCIDLKA